MYTIINGHNFTYEVQTVIQIFYPNTKFIFVDDISNTDNNIAIRSVLIGNICTCEIYKNKIIVNKYDETIVDNNVKYTVKKSIYKCLSNYLNVNYSWGMLTSIRPAKIARDMINNKFTEKYIIDYLINNFFVDIKKALLTVEVAKKELETFDFNSDTASIYIGIPFCKTKCTYCSFTSFNYNKYLNNGLVEQYINKLIIELKYINKINNKKINSIYIGGGTPTSLDDKYLEQLLIAINEIFDINSINEFTLEAGRPDTITKSNLLLMKKYGVNRISVNAQTFNEETLVTVGRSHSVNEFKEKYLLARESGFTNINVDLILGLPNETLDDVKYTFNELLKLNTVPESVTVHTLTVKRGSELKFDNSNFFKNINEVEKMIDLSYEVMKKNNLNPYYMYKQKNTIGSLENVGYAKIGFENLYNILIMEEETVILSAGVAGVSKIFNKDLKLERIFNFKSVEEYINRHDEIISRKKTYIDWSN